MRALSCPGSAVFRGLLITRPSSFTDIWRNSIYRYSYRDARLLICNFTEIEGESVAVLDKLGCVHPTTEPTGTLGEMNVCPHTFIGWTISCLCRLLTTASYRSLRRSSPHGSSLWRASHVESTLSAVSGAHTQQASRAVNFSCRMSTEVTQSPLLTGHCHYRRLCNRI